MGMGDWLRRVLHAPSAQPTSPEPELAPISSVNSTLQHIFANHRVPLMEKEGWLTTNGGFPACRGYATQSHKQGSSFGVRLDVEFAAGGDWSIIESFADGGATLDDASQSSITNFCQGSLHVMLSAFWNVNDDTQVLQEEWILNNKPWRATIGNVVRKSARRDGAPDPPGELLPAIEAALKSQTLTQSVHWVRIYYANVNLKDRIIEALLNNEPWEKCVSSIRQLNWPVLDYFYSCRLFFVLQPIVDDVEET